MIELMCLLLGALLGVATLPLGRGAESPLLHVSMWAALWPLLLIAALISSFKKYIRAWRKYLSENKGVGQMDDSGTAEFMRAHSAVRNTYSRRK